MKFNLFLISIIIILCLGIKHYQQRLNTAIRLNQKYQKSQNQLVTTLRRIHNEKIILQQQKTTLKACSIKDKPIFDWYIDISDTAVIKQLQAN